MDLGSSVPTIANLRALPCPTDALWPQVVFDLEYPGNPPYFYPDSTPCDRVQPLPLLSRLPSLHAVSSISVCPLACMQHTSKQFGLHA